MGTEGKGLITQQVFHLALLLPGDPKAGLREGVTDDLQREQGGFHC